MVDRTAIWEEEGDELLPDVEGLEPVRSLQAMHPAA